MKCPNCGGENILGEMASFWVALTTDEEMKGDWRDYQASTDVSERRRCSDCEHEWEA